MSEQWLSIWEHLSALRRTFFCCCAIILVGMLCAFCFYQELFSLLTSPLQNSHSLQREQIYRERLYNGSSEPIEYTVPAHAKVVRDLAMVQEISPGRYLIPPHTSLDLEHARPMNQLILLGPLEGFMTSLKMSFWVGIIGTVPFWGFLILQFILPALHVHERRLLLPFIGLSLLFLILGVLFAYYVTIPIANSYLQSFNEGMGINLWTLAHYLDYTVVLLLGSAAAFELAVVLAFLVHLEIIRKESLINRRRHMIVGAFIAGAILTPPDILTQFLVAIPLIALYELIILYAKVKSYRTYSQCCGTLRLE